MAKLVSNELGEEEIDETRENYSYGANSIRDGISLSNQRITRPIISYTEVMDLKNLECFLRLPGTYPITKLKLKLILNNSLPQRINQLRKNNIYKITNPKISN